MSDAPGFRYMHTMIRVLDLDKSIAFYTEVLGMTLLRREDYPGGKFTNAFVGYGPEDKEAVVELTLNWGREEPYEIGTGFGHLALGVNIFLENMVFGAVLIAAVAITIDRSKIAVIK